MQTLSKTYLLILQNSFFKGQVLLKLKDQYQFSSTEEVSLTSNFNG